MYVYLFIIDTKEKLATKGIHVHNFVAFSKYQSIELDEYSRILGHIRQNFFTCLNH